MWAPCFFKIQTSFSEYPLEKSPKHGKIER